MPPELIRHKIRSVLLFAIVVACFWTTLARGDSGHVDTANTQPTTNLPDGFRSEFAEVNDLKLHYVIGGHGSPILLIHGWPETWYEWRKMMPLLAKEHTVVAVDMRGFGESQIALSGYDKKQIAEDCFGLMTRLGYQRTVVVGHDWGAPVACAYAALHRDAVEKLVSVEGIPDGPWSKQQNLSSLHNPSWFFGFFEIPDYAEKVVAGHEREFLDWFYRNQRFHVVPGAFSEADIAYYETVFSQPGRLGSSIELYRTLDQDILDNSGLSKTPLTLPVLAVGAERGIGNDVPLVMQLVATNVTPVLLENTGHFIPEERPQVLAGLIQDFIAGESVPATWKPAEAALTRQPNLDSQKPMKQKPSIVLVVTSHAALGDSGKPTGVWLEELSTPYYAFVDAGADVAIVSIKGGAAPLDPSSTKGNLPESAARFLADPQAQRIFTNAPALASVDISTYDAIFLPGGHGTMWDLPDNETLAKGLEKANASGRVIAAVCHGPAGFVSVKNADGSPFISGKKVSAFTNEEEAAAGLSKIVPFLLESRLTDLGARFQKGPKFQPFAVRDGNLVTGQNPASAMAVARLVLEALSVK